MQEVCEIFATMFAEISPLATRTLLWGIPLFTLAASLFFTVLVLWLFPTLGILDRPEKYGLKRSPIPYPGGVAIVLSFLLSLFLFFPFDLPTVGLAGGIILLAVVSFWDDRKGVPPFIRLAMQVFLGLLLILSDVRIVYISNPFGSTAFQLPFLLSAGITILWVIGLVNTLNWLDGVAGVASGTSAVAGIFMGILSLTPVVHQPLLAVLCFTFAAANLGFTFFNLSPPRLLNGDTGAMFSGFVIAVLAIFSGGKMATVFLVLALPLFDAAAVILHRLLEHRSPLQGKDEKHLHDQLKKRGWSERKIMFLFLGVSILLGLSALYLKTLGKIILLFLIGIFVFLISWQHHRRAR